MKHALKLGTVLLLMALPAAAWADCQKSALAGKSGNRKIASYLDFEIHRLNGKSTATFHFKAPEQIGAEEERKMFVDALWQFDNLLEKKACPSSLKRVHFIFPKSALAISVKDLKNIRKLKNKPEWESHAFVRSKAIRR